AFATRDREVVRARGVATGPIHVLYLRVPLEEVDDLRHTSIRARNDVRHVADLCGEPRQVAVVNRVGASGDVLAKVGGGGYARSADDRAGYHVSLARGVLGQAVHHNIGVGQDVDVERRHQRRIEQHPAAVPVHHVAQGGEVRRLHERVRRRFGDQAGKPLTGRATRLGQRVEVHHVRQVHVVAGDRKSTRLN